VGESTTAKQSKEQKCALRCMLHEGCLIDVGTKRALSYASVNQSGRPGFQ
jgi:hypothetical protein